MDDVAGCKLPLQNARQRIDAVNISVAAADINSSVVDRRRRCVDVPRIRNGLEARWITVQPFAFETSFILGYEGPFHRTRLRIDGIKNSIEAAKIDQTIGDSWR